jgi:5S rRNA maturation endonuclease (ribonuclease M5)
MSAPTLTGSSDTPSGRIWIIVEGPDDKNIIKKILERSGLTQDIEVRYAEGFANIPQTISQTARYAAGILVIFDIDRDQIEARIQNLYHLIWKNMLKENVSIEPMPTIMFGYIIKFLNKRKEIPLILYPAYIPDDFLVQPCAGIFDPLPTTWPHGLLDLILSASFDIVTLENLLNRRKIDLDATKILNKICEILVLLQRQGISISSAKLPLSLVGALTHHYGSLGVVGSAIVEAMSEEEFQRRFGTLVRLVQWLKKQAQSPKEPPSS